MCAIAFSSTAATAQQKLPDYPRKPVRVIVAAAPGGGIDILSRAAGQILTEHWGQPVVVDNRAGGGSVIAIDLVAQAPPDGYTLLAVTSSTLVLVGAQQRVKFDIRKAFEFVLPMSTQSYVLFTHPSLPAKSLSEFIAYAKTKPNSISFGSPGVGSTAHVGTERFAAMAGIRMVHVPYKGAAPALLDLVSGQIQFLITSTVSGGTHLKSGKLRALAVTGPRRVPSLPDLPTVSESGVPGYVMTNSYSLFAPARTPRPIVDHIRTLVSEGMRSPQMAQRLAADGSEPGERMTSDQFKAEIIREYAEAEKLVKQLDLKAF
jgi:tripartite-type tricarboxylate transporter receptor subunit TctC